MRLIIAIIVTSILMVIIWLFVIKLAKFNTDLVEHPEKKMMLSIDDMFPNKGLAKFFKVFLLADLAIFSVSVMVTKEIGADSYNPFCMIFGTIFIVCVFLISIHQLPYTIKNLPKNGFVPVFCSLFALVFSLAFFYALILYL